MRLIDADKILEALGVFKDEKHGDPHFLNGIATARKSSREFRKRSCGVRIANITRHTTSALARIGI